MQKQRWWLSAVVFMAMSGPAVLGAVRLPKILSSRAVLQRHRPLRLWGWAAPGERVTTRLDGETGTAVADRLGHWMVTLAPHGAGGPYQLTVEGTNKIVLEDILLGDVWFASGQSNMEMPLSGFEPGTVVKNGNEEIRNATHPDLRLLTIPKRAVAYPLQDFEGAVAWTECTPETAAKFSAVAYFFGREIAAKEHVAVGLIDSTWGGTPGEAWVSLDGLTQDAGLMPVFATWAKMAAEQADLAAVKKAEEAEDEAARQAHAAAPEHEWHPPEPASYEPGWLFNGMVAPAVNYGINGVIWYQGETNSKLDRAPYYERVFERLIKDWRAQWGEGNFPFVFAQISSFRSNGTEDWAVVREAQRRTLELANTAMAVTIDVGNAENVHPADKQTVAARMALGARAVAYGEKVEWRGPMFRQASEEEGAMRVWFDSVEGGLAAKEGAPKGFEVAGADHRFMTAGARVEGTSVVVSGGGVKEPKYVRYGWANAPAVNLFDGAGLPASPFTSEERYGAAGRWE